MVHNLSPSVGLSGGAPASLGPETGGGSVHEFDGPIEIGTSHAASPRRRVTAGRPRLRNAHGRDLTPTYRRRAAITGATCPAYRHRAAAPAFPRRGTPRRPGGPERTAPSCSTQMFSDHRLYRCDGGSVKKIAGASASAMGNYTRFRRHQLRRKMLPINATRVFPPLPALSRRAAASRVVPDGPAAWRPPRGRGGR